MYNLKVANKNIFNIFSNYIFYYFILDEFFRILPQSVIIPSRKTPLYEYWIKLAHYHLI